MKKLCVLALTLLFLLGLAACGAPEAGPEGVPIAVLAAMNMEARHLVSRMENPRSVRVAGRKYTRGRIGKAEVVLCQSGMGLEKAGAGARALIEAFQPETLVLFGMSGGIVPEIGLYETVIAQSVYPAWIEDGEAIATDETLAALAAQVLEGERTVAIATGEKMTWRRSDYDKIASACGAAAVDQESYAVANAAREMGVPLLIIRCMSDTYDNSSLLGFFKYGPVSAEKAATDAAAVIAHLDELESTCLH